VECKNCGLSFFPKSKVNVFCSQQCRWAYGRTEQPTAETKWNWHPVCGATPVKISVPKASPNLAARKNGWKTALILPDPQIGYRWLFDGTLEPFHDDAALNIARQIAEVERPDLTIWLGDFLDLPAFGKYRKEESLALTTQKAIDAGHVELAVHREFTKEMRLIEGNHDVRLHNAVTDNLLAAAGLRRAGRPNEYPALSVPSLLRLDDLGIEYVSGYPAGATAVNDNLVCIHGTKVDVSQVVSDERTSVIQGHVHRIQTAYKTRSSATGEAKFSLAHSPGCLCRIDGAVPSVKGGIDSYGHSVRSLENWQQGLTVVRYQSGDGAFALESVPIFNGRAIHRGEIFTTEGAKDE